MWMLTKSTVDRLAQNLRLDADTGVAPTKTPELDDEPNFQQLCTITEPEIKRLYALFVDARERAVEISRQPDDPNANHLPRMRPHALLINALLFLFERAVRTRYNIADHVNIVIDARWRVFSYSAQQHQCDGDCSNCDQADDCDESHDHECSESHDCGPNCISKGGTGCGRPNCSCEEPTEPVERLDIRVGFDKDTFTNLKAVGVCLAGMLPTEETSDDEDCATLVCINEPMYHAMKLTIDFMTTITGMCETERGWSHEPDEK